jgi:basic membrane protein A
MTFQSKRSMIKLAGLGSIAAAAALVGCGKKEEAPAAAAPAAPVAAASAAPAKAEPLKIAFAYVGPVGDGGWTFAHDNARKSSATRSSPASSRRCPRRPTPNACSATWRVRATS